VTDQELRDRAENEAANLRKERDLLKAERDAAIEAAKFARADHFAAREERDQLRAEVERWKTANVETIEAWAKLATEYADLRAACDKLAEALEVQCDVKRVGIRDEALAEYKRMFEK
jgi:uncharacterized coiled-coil DUF342 family protein